MHSIDYTVHGTSTSYQFKGDDLLLPDKFLCQSSTVTLWNAYRHQVKGIVVDGDITVTKDQRLTGRDRKTRYAWNIVRCNVLLSSKCKKVNNDYQWCIFTVWFTKVNVFGDDHDQFERSSAFNMSTRIVCMLAICMSNTWNKEHSDKLAINDPYLAFPSACVVTAIAGKYFVIYAVYVHKMIQMNFGFCCVKWTESAVIISAKRMTW